MKYTRKSKLTTSKYQARSPIGLEQPGVSRQVARIVHRGDREHLVPGTCVTMDELHQYQLLGRQLQARAMGQALASLARALSWPFRKLARAQRRLGREAAAIRQLRALDDHLLRDIGISRDAIPHAVAGLAARIEAPGEAPTAEPVPVRAECSLPCNDAHAKKAA